MKTVKIGCCGFPTSRKKYYSLFKLVELQNTFYNLPRTEWAKKTRDEAPREFEFTVKAWQVLTHPHSSPTWRKLKTSPPGVKENYGWLKPTKENLEAFNASLNIARILGSKIIILQTPRSLPLNDESIKWIDEFFEAIKGLLKREEYVGWEPRGKWADNTDVLKKILCRHRVIHVVDVFKRKPVCTPDGITYIRLHGIGGEVNYRYKYTDSDLEKLADQIIGMEPTTIYVLFNNVYMLDDAKRFHEILSRKAEAIGQAIDIR